MAILNSWKNFFRLLGGMAFLLMFRGSDPFPAQQGLAEARLEICDVSLKAELAVTDNQWIMGLAHRMKLESGRGMLFIFDKVRPLAFTSRSTYIPLSIAFIGSDGVIEEVHSLDGLTQGTSRVESGAPYRLALEVPFGWFKKNGIAVGCTVRGIESL